MTTVLFQPKNEVPEWRLIYDLLLEDADFGDIITYEDLDSALGRRFLESRTPLYKARLHMGEMRNRWLESVKGVGYRVIAANEHMKVAQGHKRKARRQLGMMVKVGEVTDLSRLTPEELASYDSQQKVNALLYQTQIHLERRVSRIEAILSKEGLE